MVDSLRTVARFLLIIGAVAGVSDAQEIRIESSPTITIGSGNDANAVLKGVVGAFRLSTGQVVVVEAAGASPIRLYKSSGAFERVVARTGGGPGEVQLLWWAGRSGDSVITFDFSLSRVSIFDIRANQTTALPSIFRNAPSRPAVEGLLMPSRQLLVLGQGRPFARTHDDGPYRDTTYVAIAPIGGDTVAVLGRVQRLSVFAKNGVPGPAMTRYSYDSLTPQTTILAHENRIIVANPQLAELSVFDAKGKALPSIPAPFPAAPFDVAQVSRGKARALGRAKQVADSAVRTAMYDLAGRPKTAPRYKRVVPGPNGELWVERFWVDETTQREFAVVDRNGKVIARVSGAPAVRFTEFGRDYGIAIALDDDGVETVRVYRVTR